MNTDSSKKIVCHNCRSYLAPGTVYCPRCGTRITPSDYVSSSEQQYNPVYLQMGTVLQGKYRINSVIGQGGFGITYDGTDLKLNMHVAIKEYYPNPIASRQASISKYVTCTSGYKSLYDQGMNNFIGEARNMARFAGQENFVAVHDYFSENNTAYIIMEFVEGINLMQYMQQHGPLTMDETMSIIMPVMNVLETIHSMNMIHRDISPSNIMILRDGRVRVLDFGAAREVTLETINLTTMSAVYKFGYSPIEQLTHGLKQGPFTDIYALCATMYEMLTGQIPPSPVQRGYEGMELIPPSQYGVAITPGQEAAILKGLAINGADRIQTIAELRDALCGTGSFLSSPFKGGRRDAGMKIILCALVAVLVAALGLSVYYVTGGGQPRRDSGGSAVLQADAGDAEPSPQETQPQEEPAPAQETAEAEEVPPAVQEPQSRPEQTEPLQEPSQEETSIDDGSNESIAFLGGGSSSGAEEAEPDTGSSQYDIPEDAIKHNGHSYYLFDNGMGTFDDALAYCRSRGGYLAVINNSEENEMLFQYMRSLGYSYAYFGYTDRDKEGTWKWVSEDSSSFEDWGKNDDGEREPNSDTPKEDYAVLSYDMSDGHWNDAQYGWDTYAYICEWNAVK